MCCLNKRKIDQKKEKKKEKYYGIHVLKNTHLNVNARRKICNRIMFVYTFIDYSEQIGCIVRDNFAFFLLIVIKVF